MPPQPESGPRWYALPLLLLGACGFAAGWMLLALRLDRTCSWLALLAAMDMVLLLRLSRWPADASRMLLALVSTAGVIGLANGLIAGGQIGKSLGMRPWEAVLKIGPDYAWLLVQLATDRVDVALYAASLALAAWSGVVSGRRPTPSTR